MQVCFARLVDMLIFFEDTLQGLHYGVEAGGQHALTTQPEPSTDRSKLLPSGTPGEPKRVLLLDQLNQSRFTGR